MSNADNSRLYDRVAKGVAAKIASGAFAIYRVHPDGSQLQPLTTPKLDEEDAPQRRVFH